MADRKQVQAPAVAEALRQAFPWVEGGLQLELEGNVVPVAIVADVVSELQGTPLVQRFAAANVIVPTAGQVGISRLENPADSGVLVTVENIVTSAAPTGMSPPTEFSWTLGLNSGPFNPISTDRGRPRDFGAGGFQSAAELATGDAPTAVGFRWFWRIVAVPNGFDIGDWGSKGVLTIRPGEFFEAWISDADEPFIASWVWTETPLRP